MKYLNYDENTNEIIGFYDDDIHENIPTPNVQISDTAWTNALNISANYYDKDNNALIVKDFRTPEEIQIDTIKSFDKAIQRHLDTKAQEFRYDNMMSARSYAGYDNEFQAEATTLAKWASACWTKAGQIQTDVQNGTIDTPTTQELIEMLPVYE